MFLEAHKGFGLKEGRGGSGEATTKFIKRNKNKNEIV
jgi:hypothetical protein